VLTHVIPGRRFIMATNPVDDAASDITVQTPLLENMVVPPVFKGLTRQMDKLAEQPLLGPRTEFPAGKKPFVFMVSLVIADVWP
jgi:hypothetical protein